MAAYQAPLLPAGSLAARELIQDQVRRCEARGVSILCCPEAVLGGLADDAPHPHEFALDVGTGELAAVLQPLSSDSVATIIGFTERGSCGQLFNSAAVFHGGNVIGVYRKQHPAIRRSVYTAGVESPVFTVGGLTFGVLICNDSNYPEPARVMAERGAMALFVPTNNGLPPEKADVVNQARLVDVTLARKHGVWVIRADVAGRTDDLTSYGSSGIVNPGGAVLAAASEFEGGLLFAELPVMPPPARAARG